MAGFIGEKLRPNAESFIRKIGSAMMTYFVQAPYALPLYLLPFAFASLWIEDRARDSAWTKTTSTPSHGLIAWRREVLWAARF